MTTPGETHDDDGPEEVPGIDAEEGAALFDGRPVRTPELVIVLVSALGTSLSAVVSEIESSLTAVGYRTEVVRVSELIHEFYSEVHGKSLPESSNSEQLMTEGDELRKAIGHGGAAMALAIADIRRQRKESDGDASIERQNVATLIRSAKHPEELRLLRAVYGPRLLIIAVSASPADREHSLRARLNEDHPGRTSDWYVGEAARLLRRDEKDQLHPLGQRVRDAFRQADVFLSVRPGVPTDGKIRRVVELWFGKPFETPTRDEQAMYYAYAAQFRSAASGRQVGAAVVDKDGEILATGTNEVPKASGGQYWVGDSPDHRDFVSGRDANDYQKFLVTQDLLQRLKDEGWLSATRNGQPVDELTKAALSTEGPLADSRVSDLLEFGRIAHAEMAAICTAARRGTRIGGATLFTTTYPCHECARLIIAAGISRVVYIDPYPKSQVPELYRDQVAGSGADADLVGRLPFVPFEGVAPRLYPEVFAMTSRSRDIKGNFDTWIPRPRPSTERGGVGPMIGFELAVANDILRRLTDAGWTVDRAQ